MQTKINIVVLVDVVGALSEMTLNNGNLSMMDDGLNQSTSQGTTDLCTNCFPGQTIQWTCTAVDLQTPVEIRSITFLGSNGGTQDPSAPTVPGADDAGESEKLGLNVWAGVVPPWMTPGKPYNYRLELQMYEGENSLKSIDSCSLRVPAV